MACVRVDTNDYRLLFNNSYTLGGSKAQFNQERQAHIPLLLDGQARKVACLGVATGSTVAGAALHKDVVHIDAVELSPLVLRYADQYFTPFNRDVFRDARVRFSREDARWDIARHQAEYDVVLGDLYLPWRTDESRLYTLEHFKNVRRALKPDGLFCQWLPLFQLTRPQYDCILRTFRAIFPDVFLVRDDFYAELPVIGLAGGRALSRLNWPATAAACARLNHGGTVLDPLARHAEGVAMMVVGPAPDPGFGPLNTLGNGWLEWDAGRNILGMRTPWFIGVPYGRYLREVHHAGLEFLPPELRAAHDAGHFFFTLEIAATLKLPSLGNLKLQINERLPPALRDDPQADWIHWPMQIKPANVSLSR